MKFWLLVAIGLALIAGILFLRWPGNITSLVLFVLYLITLLLGKW